MTKEPQYQRCIDEWNPEKAQLGPMTSQVWQDDPKRLGFMLARYKFVAKMLAGMESVLEVGCGDAFASRIVQQTVKVLLVTDFDPEFVTRITHMTAEVHDMTKERKGWRVWDGIYALDVLEHIHPSDEHRFLDNCVDSLSRVGVLIVGTPNVASQAYASLQSKAGHVNCKSGDQLKQLLHKYFHNVFIFSMNDEVVHTGFYPMAHYLLALCANPK